MIPLLTLLPSIVSGFGTVAGLVAKYFPSAEDAAKVEAIKAEIKVIEDEVAEKIRVHDEAMANLEINKLQAESTDKFVSRARPFAMWGASVGTWVFFGITPFVMLVCVLVAPTKLTAILELLNTLGTSGYINTFITIAIGLYGIRGGEKAFNVWRATKNGDSIMTYDVLNKGKVGK